MLLTSLSLCFQAACNGATPAGLESGKLSEQHLTVDCDDQALKSVRHNLFSDCETNCIDNTVPLDVLQPKSEHKHETDCVADVDSCSEQQIDSVVGSTDNVQSIVVKLPLIMRLRRNKSETPELCHVKMEVADADGDSVAADGEPIESATDDAVTTEEAETDVKKETTAAAKGLQLARETIASIFGTEVEPRTMMKIPIKRRAERELNDTKHSLTPQSGDVHDRSSKKRKMQRWYVCELLNTV